MNISSDFVVVIPTDKDRYSIRPIEWAGVYDIERNIIEGLCNHLAVCSNKDIADYIANLINKDISKS